MNYQEAIDLIKREHSRFEVPYNIAVKALSAMPEYEKLKERDRAKSPAMKYERTYTCPPDCGGEEYDEYGDIPHCPSCDEELNELTKDAFCRGCGQRIDWTEQEEEDEQ